MTFKVFSHSLSSLMLGLLLLVGCNTQNTEQGNIAVLAFSPETGPRSGGITLTLTGTDLQFTNQVTIGGQLCTDLVVVSSTTLTCTLPANPAGEAEVVVRNVANNFKTAQERFVYNSGARIDSVSPDLGPTSGGTNLTITGEGFSAGSVVRVGGAFCTSVVITLGGTQINCDTTARSPGSNLSVTVLDLDGDTTLLNNAFTYEAGAVITTITPNVGSAVSPASITINGSGFDAGGATVTIDGVPCTSPVATATSITCQPAASTEGPKTVVVTNRAEPLSNGFTATRTNGYTYIGAPTVTAVSPENGRLAGGEQVTLTGTNFYAGMTVTIGTVSCSSVNVVNTTTLTCLTGARSAGTVSAEVTTVFGTSLPGGTFNYRPAPAYGSVAPTEIGIGGGPIVITATDLFETITPASQPRVFVNGQSCPVTAFTAPSSITCTAPALTPAPVTSQAVSIQIINPDNQSVTQTSALTYIPAPTVTSVVKNSGPLNAINSIVVNGYGFTADTVIEVIRTGPVSVACAVTAQSATQITCNLAAAGLAGPAAEVANVRATNPTPSQTTTLNSAYTFRPAPELTATDPVSGNPAGLYNIDITGTGFIAGADLAITIGGNPCDSSEYVSATLVRCMGVPAGALGPAVVSVTNDDGQVSTGAVLNFTYRNSPSIVAVEFAQGPAYENPDPMEAPQRNTLRIEAADFDDPSVTVTIGGVSCPVTSIVGSDIFCDVPEAPLMATIPVALPIVIRNTDAQVSSEVFDYIYVGVPSITSVSPTVGAGTGVTSVTITGSNFSEPISSIDVAGEACTVTSFSASEIVCDVTGPGASASGSVVITQLDGLVSENTAPGFRFRMAPVLTVNSYFGSADTEHSITIEGTEIFMDSVITLEQGGTILSCPITAIDTGVTPNLITCTKPAFAAGGLFTIRVVNVPSIPLEDELPNGIELISDPTITSVDPFNRGMPGDVITVTGTNFNGGDLRVGVDLCGTPSSSTTITCTLPAGTAGLKDLIYINNAGRSVSIPFTYLAAPTILSVTASSYTGSFGSSAGGTAIRITGTGFIGAGWSVSLGGSACTVTNISVAGDLIECTTSAHAVGEVDVVVSLTATATVTLTNGYRYIDPPTPTLVDPVSLTQTDIATSRLVRVTTSGYFVGTPVVSFGGVNCSGVVVIDPLNLDCTLPAHPTGGAVAVSITNGDLQTASETGLFTFTRAPTITSVSPSAGSITGATSITVSGADILAGARVYLGSYDPMSPTTNECTTPVVNLGAQTITCLTPNFGDPLTSQVMRDVIVVNTDTQTGVRTNGYTYQPAPVISSVEPELFGPLSGGNQLTINGDYFYSGVLVTINGIICGPVILDSVNRIRCNAAPAPGGVPGSYTLRVFNSDTQQATATYNYVNSPTVTSFNRNIFLTSGFETLVINGTGFRTGVTVRIGALDCVVSSVTDTQIECETPVVLSEGTQNVTITNLNGQNIVLSNALYFNAALNLSFISPTSGPATGGNSITLSGTGFYAGMTITIGGVACNDINVISTTLASCSPAGGAAGAQDVEIGLTSPVQVDSLVGAYTYREAPSIASILPVSGSTAGGTEVTITGTNFVTGSVARFNGVNCTSVSSLTATTFTCLTPARAAGAVTVFVTNPDGQTTPTSVAYTYNNPPTLSNITPTFGAVSGGTTVTINGTNLIDGAVASVGGVDCVSTTFVNSTRLTCVTDDLSTGGLKTVVVTNPDTQTASLNNAFNALLAPTLSSVSPLESLTTGGITIRFTGANFQLGSIARINGINCSSTSYISSTELDCAVPAAAAATGLALSVLNPDGQNVTGTDTFSYVDEARLEWVVGGVSPTPPNPDDYGTTSTNIMHTYTLKNVGTVASDTVAVSIEGVQSFAFMIHTNNCGAVMAPDDECTVSINFLGSMLGSGSYSATLRASSTPGGVTENIMQGSRP